MTDKEIIEALVRDISTMHPEIQKMSEKLLLIPECFSGEELQDIVTKVDKIAKTHDFDTFQSLILFMDAYDRFNRNIELAFIALRVKFSMYTGIHEWFSEDEVEIVKNFLSLSDEEVNDIIGENMIHISYPDWMI